MYTPNIEDKTNTYTILAYHLELLNLKYYNIKSQICVKNLATLFPPSFAGITFESIIDLTFCKLMGEPHHPPPLKQFYFNKYKHVHIYVHG